jgi:hypothetical protein
LKIFAKVVKCFSCELLIYIKDSPDTTIGKVFPIKMAQPGSGAVEKTRSYSYWSLVRTLAMVEPSSLAEIGPRILLAFALVSTTLISKQ